MTRNGTFGLAAVLAMSALPANAQSTWPGRDRLQPEACTPATGDAAGWLRRADSATGLTALGPRVLSFHAIDTYSDMIESDRPYPPFLKQDLDQLWWFDGRTGVERWGPVGLPGAARLRDYVRSGNIVTAIHDTVLAANLPGLATFFAPTRSLNPLAVLRDWEAAPTVEVVQRCDFRDYPRIVLQQGAGGDRLYLDAKTAVPVKLERIEPHYLWGQVRVEYIYATWWRAGPASIPISSTRYIDGVQELARGLVLRGGAGGGDAAASVSRDSTPAMPVPTESQPSGGTAIPNFTPALSVDTVRAGQHTFLLTNPSYTHAVTLARDTVFLFDATTGDVRSRADSAWIAKLFPGRHAVVLIVTDAAWPHVSGMRFWVAHGATIITHAVSKPFLQQIVDRRWTLRPDALELARTRIHPSIRAISAPLDLAGGAIRLAPIDGVASEGALMAFIRADEFLWASDYIQTVASSSQYAREVREAVARSHFAPMHVAAEHLPLTPWAAVEAIVRDR